jgi:hypothetical protein
MLSLLLDSLLELSPYELLCLALVTEYFLYTQPIG